MGVSLTLCPSCPRGKEPAQLGRLIELDVDAAVAGGEDDLAVPLLLLTTTVLGPCLGFWMPSTRFSCFLVAGGIGFPMQGTGAVVYLPGLERGRPRLGAGAGATWSLTGASSHSRE